MKYVFPVYRLFYNKVINGEKHVDIRLWDETLKDLQPNDIFEYFCQEINEKLFCVVRGVMVFDTLSSMEQVIHPSLIGYSDWNEIRLRLERLYPSEKRRMKFLAAILIETIDTHYNNRRYGPHDKEYDDEQMVNFFANKKSSYQTMKYRDDRRDKNEEELEKNSEELLKIAAAEQEAVEDEKNISEVYEKEPKNSESKISSAENEFTLAQIEQLTRNGRE